MKNFQDLCTELRTEMPLEEDVHSHMPPNILVLKRKTVRSYPGGTMMALYYNQDLDQYFSIPYGPQAPQTTVVPMSLKEGHKVGDTIHYSIQSSGVHKKGTIKKIESDHVVVHRDGYNYKVPHTSVAHNERLDESASVNWIEEFKKHMGKLNPTHVDHINWEHADHLHKMGHGPYGAAKAYITSYAPFVHAPLHEDAISHLRGVVSGHAASSLKHNDGTKTFVDHVSAHALLKVHDALSPAHQKVFADHLEHSRPKFHKMLDFTWKHVTAK